MYTGRSLRRHTVFDQKIFSNGYFLINDFVMKNPDPDWNRIKQQAYPDPGQKTAFYFAFKIEVYS